MNGGWEIEKKNQNFQKHSCADGEASGGHARLTIHTAKGRRRT